MQYNEIAWVLSGHLEAQKMPDTSPKYVIIIYKSDQTVALGHRSDPMYTWV